MARAMGPAILCLAHLGWDDVWQRPQQLLSRLAGTYPVAYVNDAELVDPAQPAPVVDRVFEASNLTAWQPRFPHRPAVLAAWRAYYAAAVIQVLDRLGWVCQSRGRLVATRPLIVWYYTPIPFYLLDQLPASIVVYDVMDDLASFTGAAPDLREREARLLARADLVFAGGRSLYEARRERHANLHLFPSGVDAAHFAGAWSAATTVPPDLAALPAPRLGYYGVIDERIDLPLLAHLAAAHPGWTLAMIGPVARKLEGVALPAAPNLHYLGRRPYETLPAYLKGFDVCLMPFAINAATRSISPTKALEYMAARKPIVSTPVPDVVRNWADAARIASGPAAFGTAIEATLSEDAVARAKRDAAACRHVAAGGWDTIATRMVDLVREALTARA